MYVYIYIYTHVCMVYRRHSIYAYTHIIAYVHAAVAQETAAQAHRHKGTHTFVRLSPYFFFYCYHVRFITFVAYIRSFFLIFFHFYYSVRNRNSPEDCRAGGLFSLFSRLFFKKKFLFLSMTQYAVEVKMMVVARAQWR